MRREQRITSSKSFSLIHARGVSVVHPLLVLKVVPNGLERSRFAFVASKRVGNAVVRNHVRRRLRELVRRSEVKPGWDAVIIVRKPAVRAGFRQLGEAVGSLLKRVTLLETDLSQYEGRI